MNFSNYSEYGLPFSLLDKEIKDFYQYYSKVYKNFSTMYKNGSDLEVLEWSMRCQKSLKESFVATIFLAEAKMAKDSGNRATFFYLMYYSNFHSMLSVLYLCPLVTSESLLNITHSKLINIFADLYARSFSTESMKNIKSHLEELKFLREYHSYHFPLNLIKVEKMKFEALFEKTEMFLKLCIQLSSFQSECLEKAFRKNYTGVGVNISKIDIANTYFKLNVPISPDKKYLTDSYDDYALSDWFRASGLSPVPHIGDYEHMYDECHYDQGKWSNCEAADMALKIIYDALMK